MSGWKAKRFWTVATAEPCDGGFTVRLDGRAVKTPAKAPVVMPTQAMAEAVQDTQTALRIDYRCDSPTLKRRYLMTIQPMKDHRVLFVHDLRDVQSFPSSFSPWKHVAGAADLKCSFCCAVRMTDADWTPPEDLTDAHPEWVDFTLCPSCNDRIAEAIDALRQGRKPAEGTTGGYGPEGASI